MTATDSNEAQATWADTAITVVVIAVGLYAAALVVAGGTIGDKIFGPLGFGPESADITGGAAYEYSTFIFGVLGAVIVGWMVAMMFIVRGPLRGREPWAWNAVGASIGIWFLVDTGFSLAVGQVEHALFNIGFLIAVAIPLGRLRREVAATP